MRWYTILYHSPIRWLLRLYFSIFYKLTVKGLHNIPKNGTALIISNHQSYLDPILLQVDVPRLIHVAARKDLFHNPFFRYIVKLFQPIKIERDTPDKSAFKRMIELLSQDKIVGLFAEGTRTMDGSISPLKTGFVRLAARCHAPVIPVVICGSYEAWKRDSSLPRMTGKIIVKFYPPLHLPQNAERRRHAEMHELEQTICNRITRTFKIRGAAWQKIHSQKAENK